MYIREENTQAVKNLLALNKQAFIGLHNIAGMDFEKEFVIIERTGKFTYKSILKELNNNIFGGSVVIKNNHIFIVYVDTHRWNTGKIMLASVTEDGFDVQRATIEGYESGYGWRWFDTSLTKRDFDSIRKSENGHYFIIVQARELSNNKIEIIDKSGRFRVSQETGRIYATPFDKNCDKHYDNICNIGRCCTLAFEFDKSGYIKGKNNYKQRLAKIRSERSSEEAAKYDNTEKLKEFEERIRTINETIINKLGCTNITDIPYYQIHDISYNLTWIRPDLQRFKENKFTSMDSVNYTIEKIDKYISQAENVLKEKKSC